MTTKDQRAAYRRKYKGKYKEKVKQALKVGYVEMGDLNLELAEDGIVIEDWGEYSSLFFD